PFLQLLGIEKEEAISLLKPRLFAPSHFPGVSHQVLQGLENYIVIHPGTGAAIKEWPLKKWRILIEKLAGHPLVFTGRGEEEKVKVKQMIGENKGCLNLVDQLSWEAFLEVVKGAALLIGVDSAAGHCASAL